MGGCKLCRLHDGAVLQLDPLDGLIASGADAGHRRLFLLRGRGFRFRLLLRFSLRLRCSIFRQILSGINVQAKAKHSEVLHQAPHNSFIHIEHRGCSYGALFHADLFTAAGLRIVVPFRSSVGIRHSFHGFVVDVLNRIADFIVVHLKCRASGSSYRIFNWRKLKDGTPVFGYQCNMRTVNPTRSFVLEHNITQQLSCDAISIPEWKLELMAKKIFEKVWGNQNKAILRACKMIESCQNGKAATRMSAAPIQSKIEKIKKHKLNYAAMRADDELPREEYQALCKQADNEIARLEQELKALSPAPDPQTISSDMKEIYDFLSQKVDVRGASLAPKLIEQFVEVVTPISDYTYRWKLNTGCKKSKEERTDLMAVSEKPILTFTIDFETAKRYREANKMPHQFRRAAWTDLTVEVYL